MNPYKTFAAYTRNKLNENYVKEETFTYDSQKRIISPGKFEGEMYYVPHFYDMAMEGGADMEGSDGRYYAFKLDQSLTSEYPELSSNRGQYLVLDLGIGSNGYGEGFISSIIIKSRWEVEEMIGLDEDDDMYESKKYTRKSNSKKRHKKINESVNDIIFSGFELSRQNGTKLVYETSALENDYDPSISAQISLIPSSKRITIDLILGDDDDEDMDYYIDHIKFQSLIDVLEDILHDAVSKYPNMFHLRMDLKLEITGASNLDDDTFNKIKYTIYHTDFHPDSRYHLFNGIVSIGYSDSEDGYIDEYDEDYDE